MNLTEQQIQELPAGRDADCHVAMALGWRWMNRVNDTSCWCFNPESKDRFDGRITDRDGIVGPFEPCERPDKIYERMFAKLPHYSTDIVNAWWLMDEFQEVDLRKTQGRYWVTLVRYESDRTVQNQAESVSAPLAIVRAFLLVKAKGQKA